MLAFVHFEFAERLLLKVVYSTTDSYDWMVAIVESLVPIIYLDDGRHLVDNLIVDYGVASFFRCDSMDILYNVFPLFEPARR